MVLDIRNWREIIGSSHIQYPANIKVAVAFTFAVVTIATIITVVVAIIVVVVIVVAVVVVAAAAAVVASQ